VYGGPSSPSSARSRGHLGDQWVSTAGRSRRLPAGYTLCRHSFSWGLSLSPVSPQSFAGYPVVLVPPVQTRDRSIVDIRISVWRVGRYASPEWNESRLCCRRPVPHLEVGRETRRPLLLLHRRRAEQMASTPDVRVLYAGRELPCGRGVDEQGRHHDKYERGHKNEGVRHANAKKNKTTPRSSVDDGLPPFS